MAYAPLFYKPVILFGNSEIYLYTGDRIEECSTMLGCPNYNISSPNFHGIDTIPTINEKAYKNYIEKYIKADYYSNPENREIPFRERLLELIK